MAETKVINLEVKSNLGGLKKEVDATAQSVTNLGNASQEATNKSKAFSDVKNVITGMVPGLKAAENGANGFSSSLGALLKNPVILVVTGIVAALKFVYEAFQSNVKIGKEIAAVWAGLSGVGSQIVDSVMGMVRAFGYAAKAAYEFVTLDFKGAAKSMKMANSEASTSYDQLTNAVNGTTFAILKGLEKQQQANNKAKKVQAVTQSEVNKLLVQSREILTDETASIKDKKKALEEVTKAETASSKEKVKTANIDLWILKEKSKALGGQAEAKMKGEIREATIALNEAETENAMTGIKLNKQRKMLLRQEMSDGKEAADAYKERAKEKAAADKEYLKGKNDVIEKIRKSEQDYADSLLTEQQKEINGVTRKYEELYKEAAKFKIDVTKIKQDEVLEKERVDKKYEDARLKIIDDANKKANDLRIAAENEYLANIEKIQEENYQASLTNEERELGAINEKYFALENAAIGNAEQLAIIEEAKNRELTTVNDKYRKEEAEKDKQLQNQKLDAVKNVLSTIGSLTETFGGKSKKQQETAFKIQKAVNIASATIDTYKAATGAYSSLAGIPVVGPGLGVVAAGAAIAAGLANVKKISSQKFDAGAASGGGGGAPSGGGGGAALGAVITPNFNIVGNNGTNQLKQLQQAPVQAYVVSGEMSTQQSLDRNRLRNATL